MIDHGLAVRYLNRVGSNLVDGMSKTDDTEARRYFQEALNNVSFLYDILHLNEVEVIDIRTNQHTRPRAGKRGNHGIFK